MSHGGHERLRFLARALGIFCLAFAVVLSATRTAERTGSRTAASAAIVRRGLEIFILAFLFRIQAFIVSPGNHLVTLNVKHFPMVSDLRPAF